MYGSKFVFCVKIPGALNKEKKEDVCAMVTSHHRLWLFLIVLSPLLVQNTLKTEYIMLLVIMCIGVLALSSSERWQRDQTRPGPQK